MPRDTIVEEVRRVRDGFAKAHGYDVRKIVRTLQREQATARRKVVSLPAKPLRQKHTKAG